MLRKSLIAVALAVAPTGVALADEDVGCGAGTILWEGQRGVPAKVMAAVTNSLFFNQWFGISSGTLGCQQGGVVTASARLPMYASANLDRIAADMAAGQGESLATLAELYGIQEADREAFYSMTRDNFASIFTETATAGDVLQALERVMAENRRFASYVS